MKGFYSAVLVALATITMPVTAADLVLPIDWIKERAAAATSAVRISTNIPTTVSSKKDGRWSVSADKASWTFTVSVPDAKAIGAIFESENVPPSATLFAHPEYGQPYEVKLSPRGIVPLTAGDELKLTLKVPAYAVKDVDLQIKSVQGAFRESSIFRAKRKNSTTAKGYTPYAATDGSESSCFFVNMMCELETDFENLDPMRRATVMIIAGNTNQCTATLVNNHRQDNRLLLLTAEHCDLEENTGNSIVLTVVFEYETGCGGDITEDGDLSNIVSGGTILHKYEDVMLLEMTGTVPAGIQPYLAGFNATLELPSLLRSASHSLGDAKHYTEYNPISRLPSQTDYLRAVSRRGKVAPGASGSGMIENFDFIRGPLSAGAASPPDCRANENLSYADLFPAWLSGEESSPFTLAQVLDPLGTQGRILAGKEYDRSVQVLLTSSIPNAPHNGTVQLSWSSPANSTCTASGGWAGTKAASGSQNVSVGAGPATRTFTLTCSKGASTGSASTNVAVSGQFASALNIAASPANVKAGGNFTVTWNSSNVSGCTASGAWSGAKAAAGTQSIPAGTTAGTRTVTLRCNTGLSTITRSASVQVFTIPPAVVLTTDDSGFSNGGSQIVWESSDATSCSASGDWSGPRDVRGREVILYGAFVGTKTYTLTCNGPGGSASQTREVAITPRPPPAITFSANKSTALINEPVNLNWSVQHASSCQASGDWSGPRNTAGNETLSFSTPGARNLVLTCTSSTGTTAADVSVDITAPAPTLTFTSSKSAAQAGETTTLTWSSTNAASCSATGGWSGAKAVSGNENAPVGTTPGSVTYTLQCDGLGGSVTRSATVTVSAPPAPTLTLTSSRTAALTGESATLSWTSTNATACSATGDWSGSRPLTGSENQSMGAAPGTKSYTLSCTGAGGSISRTASITVTTPPPPAPSITFTASTASNLVGESADLTWTSANTTACTASGGWTGGKTVSGTERVGPATTAGITTYTLTCAGPGGSTSRSVSITTSAIPTPPSPPASGGGGGGPMSLQLLGLMLLLASLRPARGAKKH